MDEKITYWAAVAFGALALVLLVLNVSFINGNRSLQDQLSQRQAVISRGQTLSQVNQGLVQALASAALKEDDKQIRDMLAGQGITLKSPAASADAAPVSAPAPVKHKRAAAPVEQPAVSEENPQ